MFTRAANAHPLFLGGVGRTTPPSGFEALINDVSPRIFDYLPDDTWFHPSHGDYSILAEQFEGNWPHAGSMVLLRGSTGWGPHNHADAFHVGLDRLLSSVASRHRGRRPTLTPA